MADQTTQRKRVNSRGKPNIKRLLANKCERERVRKINEAFEILKTHIPYCDSGRIRTKLDVLRFAIDYIQILTKMVSQSEAAMLLNASQTDKANRFTLSAGASECERRVPSTEMFLTGLEGSSEFSFDQQRTQLELTSPILSSDEAFFGAENLNKEESTSGQFLDPWSNNHQTGFQQLQSRQQYELSQQAQTQRTLSLEDQLDMLPFLSFPATDVPNY